MRVLKFDIQRLNRAISNGTTLGMLKLAVRRGRLVGVPTIVPTAGERIDELALAVRQ